MLREHELAAYRQREQEARRRVEEEQARLEAVAETLARALTVGELRWLSRVPIDSTPPAVSVVTAALRHHEHRAALEAELQRAHEDIERHTARAEAHDSEARRIGRMKLEDEHERLTWQSRELKLRDEARGIVNSNQARIGAIEEELARLAV